MAAPIPDQGAIAHLGGQFHHNVFEHAQKKLNTTSKKFADAHVAQVKQTAANRDAYARSAAQGIKQGQAAYAKQQATQQKNAKAAATAHAKGVKSGRVAPAQGAAPRTFAMAPTPQAKAQQKAGASQARNVQSQVNTAHGEALKFQAQQAKTMQSQRNFAHGEAIREANQRAKSSGKAAPAANLIKVPSMSPGFSSAPSPQTPRQAHGAPAAAVGFSHTPATHTPVPAQGIAATSFSSQFKPQRPTSGPQGSATASFSSGSAPSTPSAPAARSGSVTGPQFPQHVHPAGSSTAPLLNLTAAQPRPNTFTTGPRNVQPNGIAARGSQLEAWANQRQAEIRKQRGSNNTQLRLGD